MRIPVFLMVAALAALPASAQQPGPSGKTATTLRGELSPAEKEAAEKKRTELKAAADQKAADKARLAMEAKIDATDRKMKKAMESICSGCMTKGVASRRTSARDH